MSEVVEETWTIEHWYEVPLHLVDCKGRVKAHTSQQANLEVFFNCVLELFINLHLRRNFAHSSLPLRELSWFYSCQIICLTLLITESVIANSQRLNTSIVNVLNSPEYLLQAF